MDGIAGVPILQFLRRLAEIFQELAVEEFDFARGTQGTHEPRNAIDDQAKAFLTLLERHLAARALNRNGREMRPLLDDVLILLRGTARLAPIDRKSAQCKAVRSQYRGRPAGWKPVAIAGWKA